jgi:hypothetical protein
MDPSNLHTKRRLQNLAERKDEVFSHARPEPSRAYEPEISISIQV